MQKQPKDVYISKRAYDGKFEVSKLRYTDVLTNELREQYQGYPDYWTKRWVCVRVFATMNDAENFVKGI